MLVAQLVAPGRIELCERPTPGLELDELLVRVQFTGICGSDLAAFRGSHPYKKAPCVLGHELAGTVLASRSVDFVPGDRVCSAAFAACGRCRYCRGGRINLCADRANLSHGGWDGSFAEYVVLRRSMTYRLPDSVPVRLGAMVEPLAIGLHAVRLVDRPMGRSLALLGSGSIGLSCLLAAQRVGFGSTVCVDLGPEKGQLARDLGADFYVDAARGSIGDVVSELGTAPDVVLVAAGYSDALRQAAELVCAGGDLVVVSYFDTEITIDANLFVSKELTLSNSMLATPADFEQVIAWLSDGSVDPEPMVTHTFSLEEAGQAMRLLSDRGRTCGKVMIHAGGSASPVSGEWRSQ